MALKNKKKNKPSKEGFYVARRCDTGFHWAITADYYDNYSSDFERGIFFSDFNKAALEADKINKEEVSGWPTPMLSEEEPLEDSRISVAKKKEKDK